jgi:hypothetical protein
VPKSTAISTYRLKASLDLINDRSSNYVAVNAVQYAIAERCGTMSKASQQKFTRLSRHDDVSSTILSSVMVCGRTRLPSRGR